MDDTAQNQAQQSNGIQSTPVQQTQNASIPAGVPNPPQVLPSIPSEPMSIPMGGKESESAPHMGITPSQPEVVISEVVAEAGVQKEQNTDHEVHLTPEQQATGMQAVKEAAPVPTQPTLVQLPDEYKAPTGFALLHQQVKKAATWLMLLLFKSQQQAAAQVKEKKEV